MQFDINRRDSYMYLDDVYAEMDTSSLPADVYRVRWNETEGFIHYMNANLKKKIVDPSVYQSLLNDWCTTRLTPVEPEPPLSLAEAKELKVQLIGYLYDLKRQAAYAYSGKSWEATDAAVSSMSAATIPALLGGTTGSGNSLVTQINNQNQAVVNKVNGQNAAIVNKVNNQDNLMAQNVNNQKTSVVNTTNSAGGSLSGQVNSNIVSPLNSGFDVLDSNNAGGAASGDAVVNHLNNAVLGQLDIPANTINYKLRKTTITSTGDFAAPGLDANIPYCSADFTGGANPHRASGTSFPTVGGPDIAAVPISTDPITPDPIDPGSGPGAATVQWTPIGQANPQSLTVTQISEIMTGITDRRTALLTVKFNKTTAVNALTSITAVIAYDATTGWPF